MKLITSKLSVLRYPVSVNTRLPLVFTYLQCEVQYNCHHSSHNPGKKQKKHFKGIYLTLRLARIFNRMGRSWKQPFKSPDMFPEHCTFLPGQLLSQFQKISKLLIRKKFVSVLFLSKGIFTRMSLVIRWLSLQAPSEGAQSSGGMSSHMPQLEDPVCRK